MYFSRAQIAETAQSACARTASAENALSDQQAAGTDLAKTAATTQR